LDTEGFTICDLRAFVEFDNGVAWPYQMAAANWSSSTSLGFLMAKFMKAGTDPFGCSLPGKKSCSLWPQADIT
jgi:hypothetical protein